MNEFITRVSNIDDEYEIIFKTDDKENYKRVEDLLRSIIDHGKPDELSEWLEDSDPGQEYGSTWACAKCMHSLHERHVWNPYDAKWRYCPWCGRKMVLNLDEVENHDTE